MSGSLFAAAARALASVRRYACFIDGTSITIVAVLLIGGFVKFGWTREYAWLAFAAVSVNLTFLIAFVHLFLIRRYERSLAHPSIQLEVNAWHRIQLAYRRFQVMGKVSEATEKWFPGSIFFAHCIRLVVLRYTLARSGFNPFQTYSDEKAALARTYRDRLLASMCEFVVTEDSGPERLTQVLQTVRKREELHFLVPIIKATYDDGPGFLSTLFALYHVHLIAGLPTAVRSNISETTALLSLNPSELGWTSARVVELVVRRMLTDPWDARALAAELRPHLQKIRDRLASSTDRSTYLSRQFAARKELRELTAGLR